MFRSAVIAVAYFVGALSFHVSGQGYKLDAMKDNDDEQNRLMAASAKAQRMSGPSLLRGGQNGVAVGMAPGTNMFAQAHQDWVPKPPSRDASGLPENTSAEGLSGKAFMALPDKMMNSAGGLPTPGSPASVGSAMMSNDPSKMKFPLRL
jgi:hypothetical protein